MHYVYQASNSAWLDKGFGWAGFGILWRAKHICTNFGSISSFIPYYFILLFYKDFLSIDYVSFPGGFSWDLQTDWELKVLQMWFKIVLDSILYFVSLPRLSDYRIWQECFIEPGGRCCLDSVHYSGQSKTGEWKIMVPKEEGR